MAIDEKRYHIVIADDSLEYLSFMQSLLSGEGYSVTVLSSADTVIQAIDGLQPDLVIADVRMPGLAPFAVIEHLRSKAATSSVPIMICTGAVNELQDYSDFLQDRKVDILLKPFDVETLLEKISGILPGTPSVSPT